MAKVNEFWVSGFTADTLVLMADGNTKPISEVMEGEWVASFDSATREMKPGRVSNTWSEVMKDVLEVKTADKSMIVAASQLFYTPSGKFKSAPDAEAVMFVDGTSSKIASKRIPGKVKLYDLTIAESHSFIANDLMVHNKGSAQPKAPAIPDPVITAGKVGSPVTVTVNGNVVTVGPEAGKVASVSVSSEGGVSTGYRSVPGTATGINAPLPIVSRPQADYGLEAYNNIIDSQSIRTAVCDNMNSSSDSVSAATRASWKAQLDILRKDIDLARQNDKNPNREANPDPRSTSASRTYYYTDLINEVSDLKRYISRTTRLTSADRAFIAGKCTQIDDNLTSLEQRLRPTSNVVAGGAQ